MSKIYVGARRDGVAAVSVSDNDRGTRMLPIRLDLRNHSPTGFEWGYGGSGPAQLALAICADALGDDARALRVYQQFKALEIAPIQEHDWTLSEQTVRDVIAEIEGRA